MLNPQTCLGVKHIDDIRLNMKLVETVQCSHRFFCARPGLAFLFLAAALGSFYNNMAERGNVQDRLQALFCW